MKDLIVAMSAFIALSIIAVASYSLVMHAGDHGHVSLNTDDWGGFGSYIGGILSPAASLLAGYMVYRSFAANAYQQKLLLARESLSRLDAELEKKLDASFNNMIFGDEHYGRPLKSIIIDLSNKQIPAEEVTIRAILALLHNTAILANSIRHYINLLNKLPSTERDHYWLGQLEKSYWIEKYSAICSRMIRIVGENAFESKASTEQFNSFKLVFGGEDGR